MGVANRYVFTVARELIGRGRGAFKRVHGQLIADRFIVFFLCAAEEDEEAYKEYA